MYLRDVRFWAQGCCGLSEVPGVSLSLARYSLVADVRHMKSQDRQESESFQTTTDGCSGNSQEHSDKRGFLAWHSLGWLRREEVRDKHWDIGRAGAPLPMAQGAGYKEPGSALVWPAVEESGEGIRLRPG